MAKSFKWRVQVVPKKSSLLALLDSQLDEKYFNSWLMAKYYKLKMSMKWWSEGKVVVIRINDG